MRPTPERVCVLAHSFVMLASQIVRWATPANINNVLQITYMYGPFNFCTDILQQ